MGYEVKAWNALYVPADTPKEAMDILGNALREALGSRMCRSGCST